MTRTLTPAPLTAAAFAPYGEVIETAGEPDKWINEGRCARFNDLATLDIVEGRPGLSLFRSESCTLPLTLSLMERHPAGSQAFIPMTRAPFLVTVAPDEDGKPGTPLAFLTAPGQGVNIGRNVWHGVLTPLSDPGLFAVIDRIGGGANLQEHRFGKGWTITANRHEG